MRHVPEPRLPGRPDGSSGEGRPRSDLDRDLRL